MKKMIFVGLMTIAGFLYNQSSVAQVKVGININIGDQPEWGPSGYDFAEYYYLPDIETYYNIPRRQFVHFSGNRWVFSNSLPSLYANYNLFSGYKVVLKTPDAYRYFNDHKVKYSKYKNYKNKQVSLKEKHNNGNHNGQYKNGNNGKKSGNPYYEGNGKGKGGGKSHGKGKH